MATIKVVREERKINVKRVGRQVNVQRRAKTYELHNGGRRGLKGDKGDQGEPGASSADRVSFDDTVVSTTTGGQVTADDVQELIDNLLPFLVTIITSNISSSDEPRDKLNILHSLEDRDKYAFLGGGKTYDAFGFTIPLAGNFPDGGFDIYEERVPLWSGYAGGKDQITFQETFTVEDSLAWGGDLVETAICWNGRNPVPFVEVTAADSATENPGNGYGEYPSILLNSGYNGEPWMLQRVRYTYNPDTGQMILYRPAYYSETADDTAFGVDWMIAKTVNHNNPGEHPMSDIEENAVAKIGRGWGRFLVSRITVNGFDGTPYLDFNPSDNMVDANTVYDPVVDDNWTSTDSSVEARIIDTSDFVERWFSDVTSESQALKNAHFVGTWSAGTNNIIFFAGGSQVQLDAYDASLGDILRVRTPGTVDIGDGSQTFALNDLIWWDGTVWQHIYNFEPADDTYSTKLIGTFSAPNGTIQFQDGRAVEDLVDYNANHGDLLTVRTAGDSPLETGGDNVHMELQELLLFDGYYNKWRVLHTTSSGGGTSLELGETSTTAYRGDRGKTAYDHSQVTTGNPHSVTKSDLGLGNVDNTSDANKPISTATQSALDDKADTSSVPTDFDDLSDGTTNKAFTNTEKTKLSGIEELADVTDATNVAAAGAAMKSGVSATVIHGSTAGTARPTGYASVTWIGSVEPTNATTNDVWFDNS